MFRFLALATLMVLLAACGASPTRRGDAPSTSEAAEALLVPVAIEFEAPDGWQVLEKHHYESAALGTVLRLRVEEWAWVKLDLFAYEVGVVSDLDKGLAQIVDNHRAEMDYAVEQGVYQSWTAGSQSEFAVEAHPVLATGARLPLRIQKADEEQGSTSYLFYRPPFALKVRASFPGYVDARTEEAIDAAVRQLIPAVKVTAPQACEGKAIELSPPADFDELDEDKRREVSVVMFASAALRHALHGCIDMGGALGMTSLACNQFEALCGVPPWSVREDP